MNEEQIKQKIDEARNLLPEDKKGFFIVVNELMYQRIKKGSNESNLEEEDFVSDKFKDFLLIKPLTEREKLKEEIKRIQWDLDNKKQLLKSFYNKEVEEE